MYAVIYRSLLALLSAFALVAVLGPATIMLLDRLSGDRKGKAAKKAPSMGGVLVLLAVSLSSLVWGSDSYSHLLPALLLCGTFGVIGFADDFLRLVTIRGNGLHTWQKLTAHGVVSLGFALWLAFDPSFDRTMWPRGLDIGVLYAPFAFAVIFASVNAVKLTDGPDGLCASSSAVYFLAAGALLAVSVLTVSPLAGPDAARGNGALSAFAFSAVGACLGFLLYGSFPGRLTLGNTGAYALGGAVAATALLSGTALLLPLMGVCFVTSAVTVLVQLWGKRFGDGRKVFREAPLHRHLLLGGTPAPKLVSLYTLITAIAGAAALLLYWFFK